MKISNWNRLIPYEENLILFNEMTNAILLVEHKNIDKVKQILDGNFLVDKDTLNTLVHGGFVIPDDFNENDRLKARFNAYKFSSKFLRLTIALTVDCNFRCKYCYQEQLIPITRPGMKLQFSDKMIRATLKATEKLIDAERPHLLSLTYYGGEPLLELNKLLQFSNGFKTLVAKHDTKYTSFIVTNGYLLDKKTAEKLVRAGVTSALVTLDGLKETHDRYRPLKNGEGTFDRIFNNIKESGKIIDITVRTNISKKSVDSVKKLIKYFKDNDVNVGFDFQMIEVVPGLSKFSDDLLTLEEFAKIEVELYKEVFKYFPDYKFNPFREIRGARCDALCKNSFVVEPDGKLYKCWGEVGSSKANVGVIKENGEIDTNYRLDSWLSYSPFENDECKNCKILPLCMGGCVFNGVLHDKLHATPVKKPYKCIPLKYNIDDMVKLVVSHKLENSKEVI